MTERDTLIPMGPTNRHGNGPIVMLNMWLRKKGPKKRVLDMISLMMSNTSIEFVVLLMFKEGGIVRLNNLDLQLCSVTVLKYLKYIVY